MQVQVKGSIEHPHHHHQGMSKKFPKKFRTSPEEIPKKKISQEIRVFAIQIIRIMIEIIELLDGMTSFRITVQSSPRPLRTLTLSQ